MNPKTAELAGEIAAQIGGRAALAAMIVSVSDGMTAMEIPPDELRAVRTLLRLVADWPGYFPNGPQIVHLLIQAGADPSFRHPARCTGQIVSPPWRVRRLNPWGHLPPIRSHVKGSA